MTPEQPRGEADVTTGQGEGRSIEADENGKNAKWIVCRKCLVAWPPHDVAIDNVHFDGPDEGPWEKCDGRLIELEGPRP